MSEEPSIIRLAEYAMTLVRPCVRPCVLRDLPERISLRQIRTADAFKCLFASSAYTGGGWLRPRENELGAWGRLFAWRTLAKLVGLNSSSTCESIAQVAEDSCQFILSW